MKDFEVDQNHQEVFSIKLYVLPKAHRCVIFDSIDLHLSLSYLKLKVVDCNNANDIHMYENEFYLVEENQFLSALMEKKSILELSTN